MSFLCVLISIILTVFVLMLGQYNDTIINVSIMYTNIELKVSFLVLSLLIFSLGILTGVLLMLSSFFEARSRYVKLKKQYDKTSIGADNADDRVKLLENKIATLEEALKKQMEQ